MGLAITQKKPRVVGHIRQCLTDLGIPFSEYPDKRYNAIEFAVRGGKRLIMAMLECGKGVENKRIPRKYIELPKEQLTCLLDALLEGDGSRDDRANRSRASYFTISEGLANDVLEIAMRMGLDARVYRSIDKRSSKRRPVYRVSINYGNVKHETKLTRGIATIENYTGKVYCFTVKNHLFITMRNGKPAIQGNSARVAEDLGGLIVKDLQLRLKYAIEDELYDRILVQNGFDPKKAEIQFHWGKDTDYEYNVNDILQIFDRNLLMTSEARRMLRKMGLELEDDSAFLAELEKKRTATVAKSQQVAVAQGNEPQIQSELQPQMQAKAQGLKPGQSAPVQGGA